MQTSVATLHTRSGTSSSGGNNNVPLSARLKEYMAKLEAANDEDVEDLLGAAPDAVRSRPRSALSPLQADNSTYILDGRSVGDAAKVTAEPNRLAIPAPRRHAPAPKPKNQSAPGPNPNLDQRAEVAVSGRTALLGGPKASVVRSAAEKLVADKLVVTEMDRTSHDVPLRKQGNLEFYDEDAIAARMSISQSPALRQILFDLYQSLPLQNGLLTEKGYRWLYKKLYTRVVAEGQRKDCEALAEQEWHAESGGDGEMDFQEFFDAMFNFIDMWCDSGDEEDYLAYAEATAAPLLRELNVDRDKLRERVDVTFMPPMLGKLLKELQASDRRIAQYAERKFTSQQIYVAECGRLKIDPLPAVTHALDSKGTNMKLIKLSGIAICGIGPLIDVIRMNKSVTQILLKGCNLEPMSIVVFCHLVFLHRKLQAVDLSGNQPVGARGAMAIHRMLCRNRSITVCRFNGTVPASLKPKLNTALETNFHATAICREDYLVLREAFQEMDYDKSGTADLKEMIKYFKTHDLKVGKDKKGGKERQGGIVNKAIDRTSRKAERVATNMMKAADDSADRQLSFTELLGYFFPEISQSALQRFVDQYEDEANPIHSRHLSCEAIESIFKKYDADCSASVSIGELHEGLVASGMGSLWEKYKMAFERYDLDGNDEFSLEEFIMLMAVLDSCLVI